MSGSLISVVTPIFNEAENLGEFGARLRTCFEGRKLDWEWIAVDDASTDGSAAVLREFAAAEPRLKILTQPRRLGSHAAIFRGLGEARGAWTAVLPADLQTSPEVVPAMWDATRHGASIVWGARMRAAGLNRFDNFLSLSYHRVAQRWTGLPAPPNGADCFLVNRKVLQEIARWNGPSASVYLRVLALPVRQTSIPVERLPRKQGRSGWTFRAKLRFAAASLLAYTNPRSWWRRGSDRLWRAGQCVAAPGATHSIRALVADWLAQHPEYRTHLDVGCGSRSHLDKHRVTFTGVDVDASRVDLLRCRGTDGVVASATLLPFAEGSFDAVWSFGLLHHLSDEELPKALAEMKRVTAAGGWILVFDGVKPEPESPRLLAALVRRLDQGSHLRSEAELRAALERDGKWDCRRLTYSWNGLESLFCCHHKETGVTADSSPCPSPPMSS